MKQIFLVRTKYKKIEKFLIDNVIKVNLLFNIKYIIYCIIKIILIFIYPIFHCLKNYILFF